MTVVDRFAKRGMFVPCSKDMMADTFFYVLLGKMIGLKKCPGQIVSDGDKLFEFQAWKELAHHFKNEIRQIVANRPHCYGLAEQSS